VNKVIFQVLTSLLFTELTETISILCWRRWHWVDTGLCHIKIMITRVIQFPVLI